MPTVPVWPITKNRSRPLRCAGQGGGGGSSRNAVWDEATLLRALRGNREAAARVARAFLEDCPRVAQYLRDALRDGDRASLKHHAHRLKGNAGILRAPAVAEAARRVEHGADEEDLASVEPLLLALEQCVAGLCDALGVLLRQTEGTFSS